ESPSLIPIRWLPPRSNKTAAAVTTPAYGGHGRHGWVMRTRSNSIAPAASSVSATVGAWTKCWSISSPPAIESTVASLGGGFLAWHLAIAVKHRTFVQHQARRADGAAQMSGRQHFDPL